MSDFTMDQHGTKERIDGILRDLPGYDGMVEMISGMGLTV